MKKKYFGILIVLIALTFIFSGCLQQVPPADSGESGGATTNVVLDGIAKAKYDFLTTGATNLSFTGIILADIGKGIILHDATSGIYVYDSSFLDTYGVNVGDYVTLNATFVYYYNDIEANTFKVVKKGPINETLTPVKLNIELDPEWLIKSTSNGDLLNSSSDPASLALWLYRYVTVEGTITLSDDGYTAIEYDTDTGTSCVEFRSFNNALDYNDLKSKLGNPVTAVGYLGAGYDKWQLCIWDSNNIEY